MSRSTKKTRSPTPLASVPTAPTNRVVLLAVSGSSPAIITETIWALANETPPVVPDLVVAVTTASGARALEAQLLTPVPSWSGRAVWEALRETLLGAKSKTDRRLTLERPVVISRADPGAGVERPLEDIRGLEDNEAAGETILAAVRRFSTDPDVRLIGLLSGGRKTMGALLHAAMSLAGRPSDRLLHVLVSEPFDSPALVPPFFFPGQPGPSEHTLSGPSARTVSQLSARIDLADVPLVALGELVFNRTGKAPASFASFARLARSTLVDAALDSCHITVGFSRSTRTLQINHFRAILPEGRATAFIRQLVIDAQNGLELADRPSLVSRWEAASVRFTRPDGRQSTFTDNDVSNAQNVVRDELQAQAQMPDSLLRRLFPTRAPIGLTRENVAVKLQD